MFYIIDAAGDSDGNMIGFTFDDSALRRVEFQEGKKLSSDENVSTSKRAPIVPIRLNIKEGRENAPLPSFMSQPAPIMSKELLETVRAAGVNNIDAHKAELYYADGKLASNEYFIINVIGVVEAADLSKSVYDEDQEDSLISMGFDSLSIDKDKTFGFLMFRLAENIVEIVINEQVKEAIEKAKTPYIRISKTENVAIF